MWLPVFGSGCVPNRRPHERRPSGLPECRHSRGAGQVNGVQRRARPYSLGQRAGVYGPGRARVACAGGSQDALYRAWIAVGERLASFNGKLRDELLDREVFNTLLEVRVLTERYRRTYNRIRPHSSLGFRPPALEALLPTDPVPVLVGLT